MDVYSISTARVIFTPKTSLDLFRHRRENVIMQPNAAILLSNKATHRSSFDIRFHLSLCQSQPTTMSLSRVRTVVLDNMTININILGSTTDIITMDITAQLPATPFSVENVSCFLWCSVRRAHHNQEETPRNPSSLQAVPPAVTVAAGSHQKKKPTGAHTCKRRHLSSEYEAVSPSEDTPTPSSGTPQGQDVLFPVSCCRTLKR